MFQNQILLREKIEKCWDIDTTFCPELWWTEDNAYGNCGVTALYINEFCGGELMEGWVETDNAEPVRHFFNMINHVIVDYTWRQFSVTSHPHLTRVERISPKDILYNDWFTERYENFKNKML